MLAKSRFIRRAAVPQTEYRWHPRPVCWIIFASILHTWKWVPLHTMSHLPTDWERITRNTESSNLFHFLVWLLKMKRTTKTLLYVVLCATHFHVTSAQDAACSANPLCINLDGDCCPKIDGVDLFCCDTTPSSCAVSLFNQSLVMIHFERSR